uniref:Synaptotagmin 15 n=1 Tax=Eptatretus burgeri TaxID=7764 RepID=A0A8C4QAE4_EPTBU
GVPTVTIPARVFLEPADRLSLGLDSAFLTSNYITLSKSPTCINFTFTKRVFFPNVLDPELCEMPPDDSSDAGATAGPGPRLRFALRYECASEQLKLWLLQGREIQVDTEPGLPLVHITLLPGKRGTVQSKIPKKTAKPVFGERFIFQVRRQMNCSNNRHIRVLSVYSVDPKGKHQLVGHVLVPLKGLQLEEGVKCDVWRSLKDKPFEVLFTIVNDPLQRNVFRMTTLVSTRIYILPSFDYHLVMVHYLQCWPSCVYCKLWLYNHNQLIKCKKTATVNGTDCPEFNKSFKFQVLPTNLDRINLCISVHFDEEEKGKPLGRVLLGPFMYSRGQQLDHWNAMLNNPKDMVKYWHMVGPPK